MLHAKTDATAIDVDAGLDRIARLLKQLDRTPAEDPAHRALSAAMQVEADAYRKALDHAQVAAAAVSHLEPDRELQPTATVPPRLR